MTHCKTMNAPIGRLLLEADETGLCGLRLIGGKQTVQECTSPLLEEAACQLEAYFGGRRTAFELPLSLSGSAFDRAVWQQLLQIGFGQTRTYGQIAAALGKPNASRAVGAACSRNLVWIVVPCHRVVAGDGKLTGFAGGMEAKRRLLEHEGWRTGKDKLLGKQI